MKSEPGLGFVAGFTAGFAVDSGLAASSVASSVVSAVVDFVVDSAVDSAVDSVAELAIEAESLPVSKLGAGAASWVAISICGLGVGIANCMPRRYSESPS
ncbi:MAG: hypothetical protein VKJ85_11605 [Prochlorothrix sp.]|nr:hypothetical protein [Prochlorothrix sp.]